MKEENKNEEFTPYIDSEDLIYIGVASLILNRIDARGGGAVDSEEEKREKFNEIANIVQVTTNAIEKIKYEAIMYDYDQRNIVYPHFRQFLSYVKQFLNVPYISEIEGENVLYDDINGGKNGERIIEFIKECRDGRECSMALNPDNTRYSYRRIVLEVYEEDTVSATCAEHSNYSSEHFDIFIEILSEKLKLGYDKYLIERILDETFDESYKAFYESHKDEFDLNRKFKGQNHARDIRRAIRSLTEGPDPRGFSGYYTNVELLDYIPIFKEMERHLGSFPLLTGEVFVWREFFAIDEEELIENNDAIYKIRKRFDRAKCNGFFCDEKFGDLERAPMISNFLSSFGIDVPEKYKKKKTTDEKKDEKTADEKKEKKEKKTHPTNNYAKILSSNIADKLPEKLNTTIDSE